MQIQMPVTHLQAISLFTAKHDVRYYLNGVAVNMGHLVATNGHYMGALPIRDTDFTETVLIQDSIQFIIPIDSITLLFKGLSAKQKKTDICYITEENGNYELTVSNVTIPFKPIDGKFPNWKQIIPEIKEPIYHPYFNWEYMAIFGKAAKILSIPECHLIQNGSSAAKVFFPGTKEFIGVLMPKRL